MLKCFQTVRIRLYYKKQLYFNCTDWHTDVLVQKWLHKFQDYTFQNIH